MRNAMKVVLVVLTFRSFVRSFLQLLTKVHNNRLHRGVDFGVRLILTVLPGVVWLTTIFQIPTEVSSSKLEREAWLKQFVEGLNFTCFFVVVLVVGFVGIEQKSCLLPVNYFKPRRGRNRVQICEMIASTRPRLNSHLFCFFFPPDPI